MWKRFNSARQWLNTGLLLAFFLIQQYRAGRYTGFHNPELEPLCTAKQSGDCGVTSTDCSHCPSVVEALHQQLQNAKQGHCAFASGGDGWC
jgi:hypothetical protein